MVDVIVFQLFCEAMSTEHLCGARRSDRRGMIEPRAFRVVTDALGVASGLAPEKHRHTMERTVERIDATGFIVLASDVQLGVSDSARFEEVLESKIIKPDEGRLCKAEALALTKRAERLVQEIGVALELDIRAVDGDIEANQIMWVRYSGPRCTLDIRSSRANMKRSTLAAVLFRISI